jgi:CRP-like cAMP-binding protein
MSDLSPGERAVLRFRWIAYDAGARPVVVASVLILLAVLAAMAAALLGASTDLAGGFRSWMFFAHFGFTTDVELGALIAGILLVIDSRTGDPFRGQRALFMVLAAIGVVGIVANITTIVVYLTEAGISALPFGTTAEMWTDIITGFLASAVVASAAAWIAVTGARSIPGARGSSHEP